MDALDVLGLSNDGSISFELFKERRREFIKRNHPDTGGSNRIAQQINEAAEIVKAQHGWA